MKVINYLLLNFILSLIIYPQSEWKWITPNPPNKTIFSSSVVGDKAYFWCSYNSVLKLDLVSDNFSMLPTYTTSEPCGPGDFSYQGIAFADSINGYITDICNGQFRTTDGGYSWTKTASSGSNISLVCFGSESVGWKLGIGGFYKTTNAGASWNVANFPIGALSNHGLFSKIYAINQNQIWMLKKSDNDGVGSGVWHSSNGGNNWTELNTGLISSNNSQVSFYDIKMNSNGLGYIVGSIYHPNDNSNTGFILKTNDLGINWTSALFPGERYQSVILLNNNDVVALGNAGNSYEFNVVAQRRSSDSGNTWIFSNPGNSNSNYNVFNDALYSTTFNSIYIAVGYSIYKSVDNGVTYQKINNQLNLSVSDVIFDLKPIRADFQLGTAWLKWNNKPYLLTKDGGQTWERKSLPDGMGYIWLMGIAEEVIYIITEQTYLYKSTDYGETWQRLYLNVFSGLQALNVFSKDEFVLSAYKNLISSTDGGNSWTFTPFLSNVFLKSTSISQPGLIIGIGNYYDSSSVKGCIFQTSDYGFNWHLSDINDDMKDVVMINAGIGFVLGAKNLYKTTNNGDSWTKILSRYGNWYQNFYCLAFSDTSSGVLFSDEGINITKNGGRTWSKRDYRIPFYKADRIAYNCKGDLFIISEASLLMVYSDQNNSLQNNNFLFESITDYNLRQNYPNPFNPSTIINYAVKEAGLVSIKVYDILGKEIATLVNEPKEAGTYSVVFSAKGGSTYGGNAINLPSGVYIYTMEVNGFSSSKKMLLIK